MPYNRINYLELQDLMEDRVGNNGVFWSNEEFRAALNEAICLWQAGTGEWIARSAVTLTAGHDAFYDVPKQIVSLTRVTLGGSPLVKVSESDLDYGFPGWTAVTGTPTMWAPVGLNKFAIYPQPTTSTTVTLEGFGEGQVLTADSDINLGDEEVARILDYTQWYLSFKEGVTEGAQTPEPLLTNFFQAVMLRNTRLQAVAQFRRFLGQDFNEGERPAKQPAGRGLGVRRGLQQ